MGKKSKTKMRNNPNSDLMDMTQSSTNNFPTTHTPMSYATAVKNSEAETVTDNSDTKPEPTTTVFGGMRTKGDGSHNPTGGHPSSMSTQHPVSPLKTDGASNSNLGNKNLPRSPSPTSDPLMLIRESLKDFEMAVLTESSESDGESHWSTFKMPGVKDVKSELLAQELLAQEDTRFIRQSSSHLTKVSAGLTKMVSVLYSAISETEGNLHYMRRTVKRLDKDIRGPNIQVLMYAELSDVMIKSCTRMLHAFYVQVQKLESHLSTINQTLRVMPKNKLSTVAVANAAEPMSGRKNRRRKHKGGCPDDKQPHDPATSTQPTDKNLLMTDN